MLGDETIKIGNLESRRDFTFVTDTASGMIAGLLTEKIEGELFNLGTGYDFSVSDIYDELCRVSGKYPQITQEVERMRPLGSEVNVLLSDNSKALNQLGWKPQFTGTEGFREALEITFRWYLENSSINQLQSDFVI